MAALNAAAGDPRKDAPVAAFLSAAAVIISLVGVQLARPATGSARATNPDTRHGIQRGGQHAAVMPVGAAECQAKRRSAGVRDKVALGTRLAAVCGVRPDLRAPLLAPMLALSSAARDQSIAAAA